MKKQPPSKNEADKGTSAPPGQEEVKMSPNKVVTLPPIKGAEPKVGSHQILPGPVPQTKDEGNSEGGKNKEAAPINKSKPEDSKDK